jgi:hypothetical protein
MEKRIWLSYDLGFSADYTGLYQWLDSYDAVECGNGLASFKINIDNPDDIVEILRSEIQKHIEIKKGNRFYVIYNRGDQGIVGKYILGNRKASPWTGYKEQIATEDGE